jgi:lipopolysaccharide export system protein LptC
VNKANAMPRSETQHPDSAGQERRRNGSLLDPRHSDGVKIDGGYSRFVDLMRWLLPVAALVLIAVLIGWPDRDNGDGNLTLSFVNLGRQDESLRMISPRYVGTDSHGQPFVITADAATQDETDQELITLDAVEADVTLEDGRWIVLQSPTGLYNRREETLYLNDWVDIYSDDGHQFNARNVTLDLANSLASSIQPVHGQGPMGLLDAHGFKILDGGKRTRFEGGVKLTIKPKTSKSSTNE